MQYYVGRVLTNTKKFDHITPVIHELAPSKSYYAYVM